MVGEHHCVEAFRSARFSVIVHRAELRAAPDQIDDVVDQQTVAIHHLRPVAGRPRNECILINVERVAPAAGVF